MIKIVVFVYILALLFTNFKSLIRVIKSQRFLNKKDSNNLLNKKRVVLIIPAMNEVHNVYNSIKYFKEFDDICDVLYVTTDKEVNKLTYKKIIEEIKMQKAMNIKVINCPNKKGTMANQLNYAIKSIKDDVIIGIYNIDSRPAKQTISYVLNNIDNNIVLQQVSYFDDKNKGILKSAQSWQNRWSIIYEMGKYLSNKKIEFKYCIGHGLFMNKCIIEKYGNFSEKDINEDNEFGYRLVINGIKIKPIPYMEKADFANSLPIYVKQQSTWVNGPLYAFKYYFNNQRSIKNFILTLLNFKAFVSWWLFPLYSLVSLVFCAFYKWYYFVISLLLLTFYISFYNYYCSRLLKKHHYIKNKLSFNIINDYLFFIVHSFGSYIALFKILTQKNTIDNKYNTEK